MATSTFIHSDDDGAVSVFVRGTGPESEILFVCEHRHWWTASIGEAGSAPEASVRRGVEGSLTRDLSDDGPLLKLTEKFGDGVIHAMRPSGD